MNREVFVSVRKERLKKCSHPVNRIRRRIGKKLPTNRGTSSGYEESALHVLYDCYPSSVRGARGGGIEKEAVGVMVISWMHQRGEILELTA